MEVKKQKQPKVIGKQYVVKVNNEPVFTTESKKEAKAYIAKMVLNVSIQNVTIVKEVVTETVLSVLQPQITTVLVASELGP